MQSCFCQKLAQDENCVASYGPDFCAIQDLTSKTLIRAGDPRNGVYYLRTMRGGTSFAAIKKVDLVRWHQRLGHPSHDSLAPLSTICGFQLNKDFLDCYDVCHRAKQKIVFC